MTFGNILTAIRLAIPLGLLLGLLWFRHEARAWHTAFDAQRQAYVAAGKAAEAKQIAANLALQARYRAEAEKTDAEHSKALVRADVATRRYIERHTIGRMRPGNTSSPGGPASPAEGADSGIPENPPADAFVAVTAANVNTCGADATYARSAYEWAQKLIREGLAQ